MINIFIIFCEYCFDMQNEKWEVLPTILTQKFSIMWSSQEINQLIPYFLGWLLLSNRKLPETLFFIKQKETLKEQNFFFEEVKFDFNFEEKERSSASIKKQNKKLSQSTFKKFFRKKQET